MTTPTSTSAEAAPSRRALRSDLVRDGIRQAITSGEYPPGSKLPNEDQLCARFGVSRTTVREAVRSLVEEQYLDRRHGSGTYVTSRARLRNSLDVNFSYTELIESIGFSSGERCLSVSAVGATPGTASRLGLAVGDSVVRLERVRTADRRPAIYSIDFLPAEIVDLDRHRAALRRSIYTLLADLGHPVAYGEAEILPVIADSQLSQALKVEPGTLLHHLIQVDYSVDGAPVLLSYEWHDPRIIEFRVVRRGPGPRGSPD